MTIGTTEYFVHPDWSTWRPWGHGHTHNHHQHCFHFCYSCQASYCCSCDYGTPVFTWYNQHQQGTAVSNSSGDLSNSHVSASHSHNSHT